MRLGCLSDRPRTRLYAVADQSDASESREKIVPELRFSSGSGAGALDRRFLCGNKVDADRGRRQAYVPPDQRRVAASAGARWTSRNYSRLEPRHGLGAHLGLVRPEAVGRPELVGRRQVEL